MKIKNFRNIFPDMNLARYNLAAWQQPGKDSVFLIGRQVAEAALPGAPDTGVLMLYEFDQQSHVLNQRLIWKPVFDGISLEDPRALYLPAGELVIGLTAVLRDQRGSPIPFPAIIKIDPRNYWQPELPPFLIISTFGPGKNITPLDEYNFLFRPGTDEYRHKLLVFALHGQIPEKLGDFDFPTDLPWAQLRMGTAIPPIWVNDHEALLIIHGITIKKVGEFDLYIYSIGRAKLTRDFNRFTVTVAPEPIITPDDFTAEDGSPLVPELHPDLRRVVYACGGIIKQNQKDTLTIYVNVGDRTTFEVDLSLAELKQGLF